MGNKSLESVNLFTVCERDGCEMCDYDGYGGAAHRGCERTAMTRAALAADDVVAE